MIKPTYEDLEYEVQILKKKLDEKQAADFGVTATFTIDANAIKTPADFVKGITMWAFHRGNWQNFINNEELTPWIEAAKTLEIQNG